MNKTSLLALAAVLALAGCSSNDTDKAKDAATSGASSGASQATSAVASAGSAASSAAGEASSKAVGAQAEPFTMPDETGKTLQAAQDDVQRVSGNPLYVSHSDDALGTSRPQLLDKHWKVCSQTPAAGTEVKDGVDVRFKTVKLDETCP